uniref:Uncharacterized protein n=1 Tax=Cryptomonas curvata TaxID=233186 RepID=A0A7S0M4Y0_9CRYP
MARNIPAFPERFAKLKQIALAANSGVLVWRNDFRRSGEGGLGRFESSENGTIMDFGSDHTYYNSCGTPPDDVQKQYLLASSPAEILDLVELVEQLMQPSTSVSLQCPGLADWMTRMKEIAAAATEGPWEWEKKVDDDDEEHARDGNQSYFGRLLSRSTGACVADLEGWGCLRFTGSCSVRMGPSAADARFMEEATPASILRLIARLKRAQVTPASPLYLRPPSALAAALDRAARGAPLPRIFRPDPSKESAIAIEDGFRSDYISIDGESWLKGIETYLAAAHPGAVLALIAEVEVACGLTGGGGGDGGGGGPSDETTG